MNFTEQEPDAGAFDINPEKGYERLHVSDKAPEALCANGCGLLTRWANLAFEAPCCSHECVDGLWKVYLEKLSASLQREQLLEAQGLTPEEAIDVVIEDEVEDLFPTGSVEKHEVTIH